MSKTSEDLLAAARLVCTVLLEGRTVGDGDVECLADAISEYEASGCSAEQLQAAREVVEGCDLGGTEGRLEVDSDARVSEVEDGFWVEAWVLVEVDQ